MSEQQSIRVELAATIHENFNACRGRGGVSPDALADVILASPVIRRIQAEALRAVRKKLNEHLLIARGPGHLDYGMQLLYQEADRIEKGA